MTMPCWKNVKLKAGQTLHLQRIYKKKVQEKILANG